MLNRRLVGVAAGVLTAIGAGAAFMGCSPTINGGGGDAGLRLSSSKLKPGQFLTISHDGISVGLPVTVDFRGTAGTVVSVQSHDVEQGRVKVAVPAFLDFSTGVIGPGEYTVTLRGLTGEARLEVEDLPQVADVAPGAVLRLFLAAAIEDYQTTIDNLTAIQTDLGGDETTDAIADLNERIAALQAKFTELGSTGQLVVNLGAAGSVTLTSAELQTADRLLISILMGFEEANPTSSKGSASHRNAGDCINPFSPPPDGAVACLEEVMNDIRTFTHQNGVKMAGYVATGTGLVITAFAMVNPVSGPVLVTGMLVSVMGGYISFTDAALEGKNTDAFLQEAGEDFDAGLEILSQLGRVIISAGSTGFEALENWTSRAAAGLDNFVTFMDNFVDKKCGNEGAPKRRPFAQYTGAYVFCEETRPPGCDNSCPTSFDGLCDDGGLGAASSVCTLGTDCSDCGPRNANDAPGPAPNVLGACCTAVGTCTSTTNTQCASLSGSYQGDNTACLPNPCSLPPEPTGACCTNGACSNVTAGDCAANSGGSYAGDGSDCAVVDCAPPAEYVAWYTGNVCCWGAPLLYIGDRNGFEASESTCSYPGGGLDCNNPLVKVELRGGFATVEAAEAWLCPQFVSFSYHYWCDAHYQMDGKNWRPAVGCDLSGLPETSTPPDVNGCQ